MLAHTMMHVNLHFLRPYSEEHSEILIRVN